MSYQRKRALRYTSGVLFIIYIAAMSYFLFFSERYGRNGFAGDYRYNLVPFQEIGRYISHLDQFTFELFAVNIFGNVIAFMPFGFWLPFFNKASNRFFRVLFWSACTSMMVEVIQLLKKVGIFDVDDIILNTLGGVLGFICYRITRLIYYEIFIKKKRQKDRRESID